MKIPCVVIVFLDHEIVRNALDSLVRFSGRLDIHVIENHSDNTEEHIRPYVEGLLAEGSVPQYVLFEENISNNAFEVFFDDDLLRDGGHDHILLTDGDLLPLGDSWLDEELAILESDPDVFACGIALDMSNLPLRTFPEAGRWIPAPTSETDLYAEARTGINLLLCRTEDFRRFWEYRRARRLKFRDSEMHNYCYKTLRRKWARTKKCKAVHLTWDRYCDAEHPYTKMKKGRTHGEWWNHDRYCGYTMKRAGPPAPPRGNGP